MKINKWNSILMDKSGVCGVQNVILFVGFQGGGVPGNAGEQWPGRLRSRGAERDGPVVLCTDGQAAAREVK